MTDQQLKTYSRDDIENALADLFGLSDQDFAERDSFGDIIELVGDFGANTVLDYLEGSA